MHFGLVIFLLKDGDGVEGGFIIGVIIVCSVRLLPHLPVFIGLFLVLLLEPEVDGIDKLFLIERPHD